MGGSLRPFGLEVIAAVIWIGLAGTSHAQTRSVTGQAGILAEWDLTATVTKQANGKWAGPLSLKHVGLCSVDGPEEKTGELQLQIPEPANQIVATVRIDGVDCKFSAKLTYAYDGTMHCPDRADMPMMLLLQ